MWVKVRAWQALLARYCRLLTAHGPYRRRRIDQGRVIAEGGLVEDLVQRIAAQPVDSLLDVLDPDVEVGASFLM